MSSRIKVRPVPLLDRAASWVSFVEVGAITVGGLASVYGWGGPVVRAGASMLAVASALALSRSRLAPIRERRTTLASTEERVRAVLCRGTPATLDQVDPFGVGVFRSALADRFTGVAGRPPYVRRGIDDALSAELLRLAGGIGGVVVVRGDPKSGKSRTLWEALVGAVGGRSVYGLRKPFGSEGPSSRPFTTFLEADVVFDGAQAVLWIDDAHEHFTRGLTDRSLDVFLDRHPGVIVAMTVHTSALVAGNLDLDPVLLDRLRVASEPHQLDIDFSTDEQHAAEIAYPDLGTDADLAHLPGWFAAVDLLRNRYRDNRATNPQGVAVAKAAIDWRRAGMNAGITREVLEALAELELDQAAPSERYTEDGLALAFTWACTEVAPWAALVRPLPGTGHRYYTDFDAVTSWASKVDPPVSEQVWTFVADHVTAETGLSVGLEAAKVGQSEIAERILTIVASSAGPEAVAGMLCLGLYFEGHDDVEAASEWYRKAADRGSTTAMFCLAKLATGQGDPSRAESWYRRAADLGNSAAIVALAQLLRERGDVEAAERWFRKAAKMDNANGMHNLGVLHEERGDTAEAEQWYRKAAELGVASAQHNLGIIYHVRGETGDAEQWYRKAIDAGSNATMSNLGVLLMDRGEHEEGERLLRQAAELGDSIAMYNLADMLSSRGDLNEAERWWRKAADLENADAMYALGLLHGQRGDVEEAETLYATAANIGHAEASFNLGRLHHGRGDLENAERWYRIAARAEHTRVVSPPLSDHQVSEAGPVDGTRRDDLGKVRAMCNLGVLLWSRGDTEGAEQWWQNAANLGYPGAMYRLGVLYYHRGEAEESARYFFEAAILGDTNATQVIADHMREPEQPER